MIAAAMVSMQPGILMRGDEEETHNFAVERTHFARRSPRRSGGHASRVRQNAALTSFAAWFGSALRAAEPGCFTCRGGRQAFGSPSPAQVSAAFGIQSYCVSHKST